MKYLLLFFIFSSFPSTERTVYAAKCNPSLTPQALTDLKKLHHEIETLRDQNADLLLIQSLEASMQAKIAELLKKRGITRKKIEKLLKKKPAEKKKEKNELPEVDEAVQKDIQDEIDATAAIEFSKKCNKGLTSAFGEALGPDTQSSMTSSEYAHLINGFLLLAKNAIPSKPKLEINLLFESDRTKELTTILHEAIAYRQKIETIESIIDAGADINAQDGLKETPLFLSTDTHVNNIAIVTLLLKHKASPNIAAKFDGTPLQNTAFTDNTLIAKMLLDNGADINAMYAAGQCTAISFAAAHGSFKVTQLLMDHHANPCTGINILEEAKDDQMRSLIAPYIAAWKANVGKP